MKRNTIVGFVALVAMLVAGTTSADVKTAAVRETTEFVLKKFSKEAAEEGAEQLSKQIESLAVKHGDEALTAVKNVGPKALKVAAEAGPQSGTAVKAMAKYGADGVEWIAKSPKGLDLAARYGDDAAEVLVKHKGVAEPLVEQFGKSGVAALKAVEPEAGRRLAMMTAEGQLKAIGRSDEVLAIVAKYGDKAADFVWKNKGALTVGTALAAFLADPEPFLNGTRELAGVVGENLVKPLAEVPGKVASEAALRVDWTMAVVVIVMALALVQVWRSYLRHRAELRAAAKS